MPSSTAASTATSASCLLAPSRARLLSFERRSRAQLAEKPSSPDEDGIRDLLRELFQARLDVRALSEQRAEEVNDAEGVRHGPVEAGHTRPLQTIFGAVTVGGLAYRCRGHANLYPADGQLNLTRERHSHGLGRVAAIEASKGSFAEATAAIGRAMSPAVRAAIDLEEFYLAPARQPGRGLRRVGHLR